MSQYVVDAGPCLNFLSLREGDLLHAVLCESGEALLAPEEVADEIRHKSWDDPKRFGPAVRVFEGMRRTGKIEVLGSASDDEELFEAIRTVTTRPLREVLQYRAKDRGEILAIAHAVLLRGRGHHVQLLLEDGRGRDLASRVGFDKTTSSMRVLALSGRRGLRTRDELQALYARMRPLDARFRSIEWQDTPMADPRLYTKASASGSC